MKHLISICRYVEPFRSYALSIDAVIENWGFSFAKFLRVGQKKIESRWSALAPPLYCVHISWRSVEGRPRSIV